MSPPPCTFLSRVTAQVVHPDLLEVLGMASDVTAASAGAFDVTVGPLVDLWGFGPPGPRPLDSFGTAPSLPLDDEVTEARARSRVRWSSSRPTSRKKVSMTAASK